MRGSITSMPPWGENQSRTYRTFMAILDTLFSSFIVAPAVISYWRSVWELIDIYIYPDNALYSSLVSCGIGAIGHIVFMLAQFALQKYLHPDQHRVLYYVGSRIYTQIFAFVCVNGWRGPWELLDLYQRPDVHGLLITTGISLIALAAIRALRNISAAPMAVVPDMVVGYFQIVTMFQPDINERLALFMLDCVFSVFVVGTLVVFAWRGSWALLDIFLFPESAKLSAWASLISGYSIVGTAFLLQPLMVFICERVKGTVRLLIADVFIFFSFVGTVNVWRGLWNLLNLYLIPENLELSCWITHCISITVLILLGCSNSLLVRGVYIDADEPDGKCVVFPCYYLRLLFEQERLKKKSHMLEKQFTSQEEKTNVQKCGAQQLKQPA